MNKTITAVLVILVLAGAGAAVYYSKGTQSVRSDAQNSPTPVNHGIAPGEPNPNGTGGLGIIPPGVEKAARAEFVKQTGLSESKITGVLKEKAEWSDGCLGLGGPAESCIQMVTPGWEVTVIAGEKKYEIRTDETGTVARMKK